jgi:hypothetical protein
VRDVLTGGGAFALATGYPLQRLRRMPGGGEVSGCRLSLAADLRDDSPVDNSRLLLQLTDPDEDVRAEAREELTMLMDDDIARAFLDVASSDAAEDIRSDAIVGLGPIIEEAGMDFDDEDSGFAFDPDLGPGISRETFDSIIREIRALYTDEQQPKLIRRRAFEVLVRDPQPWQSFEIRRHFAGDDPLWKLTAVFGMGYVAGFDKEIAATVESADDQLLYEAIRAASSMEVSSAAKRIRDLATSGDTEHDLRLVSIEALPNVDPDCEDILDTLAASRDREIAETAQAALDELMLNHLPDDEDDDLYDEDFEEDEED